MKSNLFSLSMCFLFFIFSIHTGHAQISSKQWMISNAFEQKTIEKKVLVKSEYTEGKCIQLEYKIPEVRIQKWNSNNQDKEISVVSCGNAPSTANAGEPVLPVIPVKIIIPAGYTINVSAIKVVFKRKTEIAGTHTIKHGELPQPLIPNVQVKQSVPDKAIYSSNNPYPRKPYYFVSIQKKYGIGIAYFNLNPIIYLPLSGKLSAAEVMSVNIPLQPTGTHDETKAVYLERFNSFLMGVDNPLELNTYTKISARSFETHKLCNSLDTYQYVVVTNKAVRDAQTDITVHDLIKHKQSRGISATIATIEDIKVQYTGYDDAEKLRNFIIDAYNNWKTEYVLLAGDMNIVPVRTLYAEGEYVPSDLYFQCLDGTYDFDGDRMWGEPHDGDNGGDVDLTAEVYIGRASVENEQEMSNFVYKTLAYENDPNESSYLRNALIAGEYLGYQFGPGEFAYARPFMEEIRFGSNASGYSTVGFSSLKSFTADTLYDFDGTWPAMTIIDSINSNKYSIINHLGHANTNYVFKFYNSDADNLTNSKFIFAYSQGCYPGDFTVDCIAEHLTTSTRSGLFAGVFNSHYGYGAYNTSRATLDGPSQRFNRQFWNAYFGKYTYNLGAINAMSHEDNLWNIQGNLIRYCYYETNLLGDPQTPLRGITNGPSPQYYTHIISDSNGGNGDGIINPGEKIDISVTLLNTGIQNAEGVRFTVSAVSSDITIIKNEAYVGEILCCGASRDASDSITIEISPSCITPQKGILNLDITDTANNHWQSQFSIPIHTSSQISGFVRSYTGNIPQQAAVVYYQGPQQKGSVTTDAKGYYRFGAIDGTYKIFVTSTSYFPSDTHIVSVPPSNTTVDFYLKRSQIENTPKSFSHFIHFNDTLYDTLRLSNTGDDVLHFKIKTLDSTIIPNPGTYKQYILPSHTLAKPVIREHVDSLTNNGDTVNISTPKFNVTARDLTGISIAYDQSHGQSDMTYIYTILFTDLKKRGARIYKNTDEITSQLLDTINLLWLDDFPRSDLSVAERNALHTWIHNGGSVVLASDEPNLMSTFPNQYGIFYTGGYGTSGVTTSIKQHPTTDSVTSLAILSPVTYLRAEEPAFTLVNDAGNNPTICIAESGRGKIVVICDEVLWDFEIVQAHNRRFGNQLVDWLTLQKPYTPWLEVLPSSDSILAGYSLGIPVLFKYTKAPITQFYGSIVLSHNDPIADTIIVPCTLKVETFKSLVAVPQTICFDTTWIGITDTAFLLLKNNGNSATVVSKIIMDNDCNNVTLGIKQPFSVLACDSIRIPVFFTPTKKGTEITEVSFVSNAADNQILTVALQGTGTQGPEIAVNPQSLKVMLDPHGIEKKNIVITNTGMKDLEWTITGIQNRLVSYKSFDTIPGIQKRPYVCTHYLSDYFWSDPGNSPFYTFGYPTLTKEENNTITSSMICMREGDSSYIVDDYKFRVHTSFAENHIYRMIFTPEKNSVSQAKQVSLNLNGYLGYSSSGSWKGYTDSLTIAGLKIRFFVTENNFPQYNPRTVFIIVPSHINHRDSVNYALYYNSFSMQANNIVLPAAVYIIPSYHDLPSIKEWLKKELGPSLENWLTLSSYKGSVTPGSNAEISAQFRASGVVSGLHSDTMILSHNAPLQKTMYIPCSLFVKSYKSLTVSPIEYDFDKQWIDFADTVDVTFHNYGNDTTTVKSMQSNNSEFILWNTEQTLTVPPFDSVILKVLFYPKSIGSKKGTITILSNATDNPKLVMNLRGLGVLPPHISITPKSFYTNLNAHDSISQILSIVNSGGDDLFWKIRDRRNSLFSRELFDTLTGIQKKDFKCIHDLNRNFWINAGNDAFNHFGYPSVLIDKGDSGMFYTDISMLEGESHYTLDNYSFKVRNSFAENHIYRMILESDTVNNSQTQNVTINLSGSLGYSSTDWKSYYDSVIVSGMTIKFFVAENNFPNNNPRTIFLILPSNPQNSDSIVYQRYSTYIYLQASGISLPATVYIIPSYYELPAIKEWLKKEIKPVIRSWIKISNSSDTTATGDSAKITVTFDARTLVNGFYHDSLEIINNTPDKSSISVPCSLLVNSFKSLSVSTSNIDFGTVWLNFSDSVDLLVTNHGNDTTNIDSLMSDNPEFGMLGFRSLSIPPFSTTVLKALFKPISPGQKKAVYTIYSNAHDNPKIQILLSGVCVKPPEISLSPESFKVTLNHRDSQTQILSIANNGGDNLFWSLWGSKNLFLSQEIFDTIQGTQSRQYTCIHDIQNSVWYDGGHDAFNYFGNPRVRIKNGKDIYLKMTEGEYWYTDGAVRFQVRNSFAENHIYRMILKPDTNKESQHDGITLTLSGGLGYSNPWQSYQDSFTIGNRTIKFFVTESDFPNRNPRIVFMIVPADQKYLDSISYTRNNWHVTMQANNIALPATVYIIPSYFGLESIKEWFKKDIAPPFKPWLSLSKTSDTVKAGQASTVPILFRDSGLPTGWYYDTLMVTHTAPHQKTILFPCSLFVHSFKSISVTPSSYDFGILSVGQEDTTTCILTNTGNDTTIVTKIVGDIDNTEFIANTPVPLMVIPQKSTPFQIIFSPKTSGNKIDDFVVFSDAKDNPQLKISLKGKGIKSSNEMSSRSVK